MKLTAGMQTHPSRGPVTAAAYPLVNLLLRDGVRQQDYAYLLRKPRMKLTAGMQMHPSRGPVTAAAYPLVNNLL